MTTSLSSFPVRDIEDHCKPNTGVLSHRKGPKKSNLSAKVSNEFKKTNLTEKTVKFNDELQIKEFERSQEEIDAFKDELSSDIERAKQNAKINAGSELPQTGADDGSTMTVVAGIIFLLAAGIKLYSYLR